MRYIWLQPHFAQDRARVHQDIGTWVNAKVTQIAQEQGQFGEPFLC